MLGQLRRVQRQIIAVETWTSIGGFFLVKGDLVMLVERVEKNHVMDLRCLTKHGLLWVSEASIMVNSEVV